jgi:hypothetical protein
MNKVLVGGEREEEEYISLYSYRNGHRQSAEAPPITHRGSVAQFRTRQKIYE